MWHLWENYDIMKKIYKGGSYMKKIISLILMCVMLLCVASCKRRPPEDVRADIPAQSSGCLLYTSLCALGCMAYGFGVFGKIGDAHARQTVLLSAEKIAWTAQ